MCTYQYSQIAFTTLDEMFYWMKINGTWQNDC